MRIWCWPFWNRRIGWGGGSFFFERVGEVGLASSRRSVTQCNQHFLAHLNKFPNVFFFLNFPPFSFNPCCSSTDMSIQLPISTNPCTTLGLMTLIYGKGFALLCASANEIVATGGPNDRGAPLNVT